METARLGKNKNSLNNEILVKTGKSAFFVCILALLVFFSYTAPLSAHDYPDIPVRPDGRGSHSSNSITAGDVTVGDMGKMRDFMLHAMDHVMQFVDYNGGLAPFLELIQQEGGDWKNGTIYLWRMSAGGVIQNHPHYPIAQNGNLNNLPVMQQLIEDVKKDKPVREDGTREYSYGVDCKTYTFEGEDRVACAVFFDLDLQNLTFKIPTILVGGLHHNISDMSFSNLKCPLYSPKTSAADVINEETLKAFMDEFVDFYVDWRDRVGLFNVINSLSCLRVLPLKNDSIYLFAMTEDTQLVVLNGNTPTLENTGLNVTDANGVDVGDLIVNAVKDLPVGEGAFVEYLWDDPSTPDDNVDLRTECPNGPFTCAPGTSPKLSYVVPIIGGSGGRHIWGSGIYPEALAEDDGGCAIAGSTDTPKRAIFNLFLIVSILFSVALARNLKAKQTVKTLTAKVGRKSRAAALFVCALALLVFFSGVNTASAHDGAHDDSSGHEDVTADEVTAADMGKMRDFMLHAKAHWESIDNPNDNIEFEREVTVEGGDWNNGTIYLMVIDKEGAVFTHADDPEAQNLTLAHYSGEAGIFGRPTELDEEVRELINAAENGGGCVPYENRGEQRVACAAVFTHPVWQSDLILLAGYHHVHDVHDEDGEEEVGFDQIQCPYFVSEIIDEEPYFKQGIGANKVVDSDSLKNFVEEFAKYFGEQIESGQNPAQLAKIRNCWRALPWKHGAVYVFIMTENNLVFFNGNGPHLENRSFNVTDGNDCDVGNEVIRVARGEDRECKDLGLLPEESRGFVEYLWEDPTDDIPPVIEEGRAPGDVPKLSYVVSFSDPEFLRGEKLIIGSGFHPGVRDDDGCAIAGAGNTAKGTLFNLFLIASVLFSAALWRNRSSSSG